MRRSNAIAAALSRYSFQLPHFGDCTHDGQPSSHGHAATRSSVARACRVGRVERELGDAGAARVAVVHEDRRLAGLRVHRHRHAADVPAVADREQRQHADEPVLGRVHRAEQLRGCDARPPRSRRPEPCTSTPASRARVPAGRDRTPRSRRCVEICLRWYATTWLRTSTAPRCTIAAPSGANCVLGDDRDVGLGARLRVLVGVVVRLEHRDVIVAVSSSSTRYCRPWCRYTAPGCATANTRASSTVPIVRSSSRSTRRYSTDDPLRSPTRGAGGRSPDQYILPAARLQQVVVHELAHGVVEPVAEPALVVGRERELVRRARDLRRAARTGSAGSRPRARARAASARRGCAAYHWSSWSSPATSTAADRRPVRPARPACCHIDASVPGKPLRTPRRGRRRRCRARARSWPRCRAAARSTRSRSSSRRSSGR